MTTLIFELRCGKMQVVELRVFSVRVPTKVSLNVGPASEKELLNVQNLFLLAEIF